MTTKMPRKQSFCDCDNLVAIFEEVSINYVIFNRTKHYKIRFQKRKVEFLALKNRKPTKAKVSAFQPC